MCAQSAFQKFDRKMMQGYLPPRSGSGPTKTITFLLTQVTSNALHCSRRRLHHGIPIFRRWAALDTSTLRTRGFCAPTVTHLIGGGSHAWAPRTNRVTAIAQSSFSSTYSSLFPTSSTANGNRISLIGAFAGMKLPAAFPVMIGSSSQSIQDGQIHGLPQRSMQMNMQMNMRVARAMHSSVDSLDHSINRTEMNFLESKNHSLVADPTEMRIFLRALTERFWPPSGNSLSRDGGGETGDIQLNDREKASRFWQDVEAEYGTFSSSSSSSSSLMEKVIRALYGQWKLRKDWQLMLDTSHQHFLATLIANMPPSLADRAEAFSKLIACYREEDRFEDALTCIETTLANEPVLVDERSLERLLLPLAGKEKGKRKKQTILGWEIQGKILNDIWRICQDTGLNHSPQIQQLYLMARMREGRAAAKVSFRSKRDMEKRKELIRKRLNQLESVLTSWENNPNELALYRKNKQSWLDALLAWTWNPQEILEERMMSTQKEEGVKEKKRGSDWQMEYISSTDRAQQTGSYPLFSRSIALAERVFSLFHEMEGKGELNEEKNGDIFTISGGEKEKLLLAAIGGCPKPLAKGLHSRQLWIRNEIERQQSITWLSEEKKFALDIFAVALHPFLRMADLNKRRSRVPGMPLTEAEQLNGTYREGLMNLREVFTILCQHFVFLERQMSFSSIASTGASFSSSPSSSSASAPAISREGEEGELSISLLRHPQESVLLEELYSPRRSAEDMIANAGLASSILKYLRQLHDLRLSSNPVNVHELSVKVVRALKLKQRELDVALPKSKQPDLWSASLLEEVLLANHRAEPLERGLKAGMLLFHFLRNRQTASISQNASDEHENGEIEQEGGGAGEEREVSGLNKGGVDQTSHLQSSLDRSLMTPKMLGILAKLIAMRAQRRKLTTLNEGKFESRLARYAHEIEKYIQDYEIPLTPPLLLNLIQMRSALGDMILPQYFYDRALEKGLWGEGMENQSEDEETVPHSSSRINRKEGNKKMAAEEVLRALESMSEAYKINRLKEIARHDALNLPASKRVAFAKGYQKSHADGNLDFQDFDWKASRSSNKKKSKQRGKRGSLEILEGEEGKEIPTYLPSDVYRTAPSYEKVNLDSFSSHLVNSTEAFDHEEMKRGETGFSGGPERQFGSPSLGFKRLIEKELANLPLHEMDPANWIRVANIFLNSMVGARCQDKLLQDMSDQAFHFFLRHCGVPSLNTLVEKGGPTFARRLIQIAARAGHLKRANEIVESMERLSFEMRFQDYNPFFARVIFREGGLEKAKEMLQLITNIGWQPPSSTIDIFVKGHLSRREYSEALSMIQACWNQYHSRPSVSLFARLILEMIDDEDMPLAEVSRGLVIMEQVWRDAPAPLSNQLSQRLDKILTQKGLFWEEREHKLKKVEAGI